MLINVYFLLEECAADWTIYNGGCYRYFPNDPKSWENARKHCLELEADLVSLHSDEDSDFMLELTKRNYVR